MKDVAHRHRGICYAYWKDEHFGTGHNFLEKEALIRANYLVYHVAARCEITMKNHDIHCTTGLVPRLNVCLLFSAL